MVQTSVISAPAAKAFLLPVITTAPIYRYGTNQPVNRPAVERDKVTYRRIGLDVIEGSVDVVEKRSTQGIQSRWAIERNGGNASFLGYQDVLIRSCSDHRQRLATMSTNRHPQQQLRRVFVSTYKSRWSSCAHEQQCEEQ
jgi:hypothetical protein